MGRELPSLCFQKALSFLCAVLSFFVFSSSPVRAVTHFAPEIKNKLTPIPIDFDMIWFYDRDGQKVIPEIDSTWLTVVFHPSIF
jgi:hypothetical protein